MLATALKSATNNRLTTTMLSIAPTHTVQLLNPFPTGDVHNVGQGVWSGLRSCACSIPSECWLCIAADNHCQKPASDNANHGHLTTQMLQQLNGYMQGRGASYSSYYRKMQYTLVLQCKVQSIMLQGHPLTWWNTSRLNVRSLNTGSPTLRSSKLSQLN